MDRDEFSKRMDYVGEQMRLGQVDLGDEIRNLLFQFSMAQGMEIVASSPTDSPPSLNPTDGGESLSEYYLDKIKGEIAHGVADWAIITEFIEWFNEYKKLKRVS